MQLTTALMWMLLSLCRQTKIGYGIMGGGAQYAIYFRGSWVEDGLVFVTIHLLHVFHDELNIF